MWKIEEYDGLNLLNSFELPDYLSKVEVEVILQRLICRNLTQNEIINASLRRNDERYNVLLEPVSDLHYGKAGHYVIARAIR